METTAQCSFQKNTERKDKISMYNSTHINKFTILKLESIIRKYGIEDLMEYTLDSQIGCRLDLLYKEILEEFLNTKVYVSGEEISDGKYRLEFSINGCVYCMVSKAGYTVENIVERLMDFVINPSQNGISCFSKISV